MEDPELARLNAEIAAKAADLAPKIAELAALKHRRRTIVAAKASARARAHSSKAKALREQYLAAAEGRGTIRRLARGAGVSEQYVHRVIKDLKSKRAVGFEPVPEPVARPDAMASPMVASRARAAASSTADSAPNDSAQRFPARRSATRPGGRKIPPPDPCQDELSLVLTDHSFTKD